MRFAVDSFHIFLGINLFFHVFMNFDFAQDGSGLNFEESEERNSILHQVA